MKRLLSLLAAAVLLVSCSGNDGSLGADYLYFNSVIHLEHEYASTLSRMNLETGNITYLCPDPLCGHTAESGCTFAGVLNYEVDEDNGVIYFGKVIQNGDTEEEHICVYDIAQARAETLHIYRNDPDSTWSTAFRFGQMWRISSVYDDGIDDYCVSMTDRNFDDPVILKENALPFAENRLYYYFAERETAGGNAVGFYLQDKAFEEEPVVIAEKLHAGEYKIFGEYLYYLQNHILFGLHLDGTYPAVPQALIDDVSWFTVTDEKIFFLRREEDPVCVGYDAYQEENIYNTYGSILWTADRESMTVKPFAEFDGYVVRSYMHADSVGDTIILSYGIWKETDGVMRWYSTGGGILAVDADTGEWRAFDTLTEIH